MARTATLPTTPYVTAATSETAKAVIASQNRDEPVLTLRAGAGVGLYEAVAVVYHGSIVEAHGLYLAVVNPYDGSLSLYTSPKASRPHLTGVRRRSVTPLTTTSRRDARVEGYIESLGA